MFYWVWYIDKMVNRYGMEGLINRFKELNIDDICIKFHEGYSELNFKNNYYRYASTLKSAGIRVGTWGFNYFNDVEKEGNLIIEAINNSDYYIFDPEGPVAWKTNESEKICNKVRNACPDAIIGYSTYPIVSYHPEIPYEVFDKYCDFASPQCYWGEMQWNMDKCISTTIKDHKNAGLTKPIYPSIESYKIKLEDYKAFDKYNFENIGIWNFDAMDNNFEQYIKMKNESLKKVKNIIVYGNEIDKRAAEYLSDYLQASIIHLNYLKNVLNEVENIYVVGGNVKPIENCILISGKDRFETLKEVLKFMQKI